MERCFDAQPTSHEHLSGFCFAYLSGTNAAFGANIVFQDRKGFLPDGFCVVVLLERRAFVICARFDVLFAEGFVLFVGEVAILPHSAKDVIASSFCQACGVGGVVPFGVFGDACEDGAFRNGEFGGTFSKVVPGCFFNAKATAAKVDLVEIEVEDFPLAEMDFDLSGEDGFADFAFVRLLFVEQKGFDDLLCDGGAALFGGTFCAPQVFPKCANDTCVSDTFVFEEMGIFGRDDGMDQVFGEFLVGHDAPPLFGEFHDHALVEVHDASDSPGAVGFDGAEIGEIATHPPDESRDTTNGNEYAYDTSP